MQEIDKYLSELSELAKHDEFFKIRVSDVIDRLLEIRNSLPEIVIDGDEMTKYFKGKS